METIKKFIKLTEGEYLDIIAISANIDDACASVIIGEFANLLHQGVDLEIDDVLNQRVVINGETAVEYVNTPGMSFYDYSEITVTPLAHHTGKCVSNVEAYRGVINRNTLGVRDRAMVMIAKIFGDLFMGRADMYAIMINEQNTDYFSIKYPVEYTRLLRLCEFVRVRRAAEAVAANSKAIDDVNSEIDTMLDRINDKLANL